MNDLIRTICVGGIILVVGAPVLWAAVQQLQNVETLPRPWWTTPAAPTITVRPRNTGCTCPIYNHQHETSTETGTR